MTNKFVFDESSHACHRVAGHARTWEQLSPGVRVRRRVVGPGGATITTKPEPRFSAFQWDFDDLPLDL
ncbi:MAG: hypothetical protein AAF799_43135 [Myxococcota bacterium]